MSAADVCVVLACSAATHDCHLEVLNLLITLLSTQLRHASMSSPPDGSVTAAGPDGERIAIGTDPFLELLMAAGARPVHIVVSPSATESPSHLMCRSTFPARSHRVVASLLNNFIKQLDAPQATAAVLSSYTDTAPTQSTAAAGGSGVRVKQCTCVCTY